MNQPVQCDAHHYQPYEGQEMCIPCLWGACMDKVYTDSDHTYYRVWYKSDCNDKCTSGFCYTEDGKYSMLAGQCTAYIYGMHSNGTVNGACK